MKRPVSPQELVEFREQVWRMALPLQEYAYHRVRLAKMAEAAISSGLTVDGPVTPPERFLRGENIWKINYLTAAERARILISAIYPYAAQLQLGVGRMPLQTYRVDPTVNFERDNPRSPATCVEPQPMTTLEHGETLVINDYTDQPVSVGNEVAHRLYVGDHTTGRYVQFLELGNALNGGSSQLYVKLN
jgi:hypothetical protein